MAHEIEQINGKASFMYVGEAPWHDLGTHFRQPPKIEEAIVAAGLNWDVKLAPTFTVLNGQQVPLQTQALYRTTDMSKLGEVGPDYTPLQNKDAFEFFRPFLEKRAASIETAGSLRDGKRVFVLAKIARDPMVVKGNDTVEKYILLSNSHDGSSSVRVGFTGVRVVCANTLRMAHGAAESKLLRLRHTSNVNSALDAVGEIMNLADQEFNATLEQYKLLAEKQVNVKDLETYVKIVFKIDEDVNSRILKSIVPLFEHGRGNDMPEIAGSYWAAFNAVSEYLQYEKKEKETGGRLDGLWFGQSGAILDRAQTVALEMAKAA